MSTFTTTFGTTSPRDLFYPNVLTPTLDIDAGKVQDTFRRVFDMLYKINPPPGSRQKSSVLDTFGFVDAFTVNLANNIFFLSGENWNSSTSGVSWNAHTLTYNGVAYQIAAGGPTTNKWIYWTLANANSYQTLAAVDGGGNPQFPDLSFVNPIDNSVASGLVAVWNSSDGKLYPFWSAKLAPAFISTALIQDAAITNALIQNAAISSAKIGNLEVKTANIALLAVGNAQISDLSADKISTGTLAASVAITLTQSDSTPAKLNFGTSFKMYSAVNAAAGLQIESLSDGVGNVEVGSGVADPLNFEVFCYGATNASTILMSCFHNNTSKGIIFKLNAGVLSTGQLSIEFGTSRGSSTSQFAFTPNLFTPQADTASDSGTSSLRWNNIFTGHLKGLISGQGVIWNSGNEAITANTNASMQCYVNNVAQLQLDTTSGTATTPLLLNHNGTLQRVTLGATDSGGTGFRQLIIPN